MNKKTYSDSMQMLQFSADFDKKTIEKMEIVARQPKQCSDTASTKSRFKWQYAAFPALACAIVAGIIFVLPLLTDRVIGSKTTFSGNTKTENVAPTSEETNTVESEKIIRMRGDWPGYATIQELVESCDHVIIGEVKNTLPVVRINETANSLHEVWHNYTPSEILIKEVIVGTMKEGDTVAIVQPGGSYAVKTENDEMETITEIMEDIIFLEKGSVYLLFVHGEENVGKGIPYSYYLPTPQVAYCQIVDDKLIAHEENHLFENGTSVKEAIAMIEESLNAPEGAG